MEQQQWTCPECSKVIAADDTVLFVRERITHFYCRRPRTLGPEERVLRSPSATSVPGDTVSPSLPTTSSVVKSTCVRNVVRTCLTAFAYISTPARCFLLKSSERLRWQDRQHKSW